MPSQTDVHFPADHPTAAGHFPGNPIIPGAVLLDTALTAIAEAEGLTTGPCRLRSAKFLRPVRPGDRMLIEWQPTPTGAVAFTGSVEGRPVMVATIMTGTIMTGSVTS